MGKFYRIRAGERFLQPSGETLQGGATIELDDDLALLHATRIETLPTSEPAHELHEHEDDA